MAQLDILLYTEHCTPVTQGVEHLYQGESLQSQDQVTKPKEGPSYFILLKYMLRKLVDFSIKWVDWSPLVHLEK